MRCLTRRSLQADYPDQYHCRQLDYRGVIVDKGCQRRLLCHWLRHLQCCSQNHQNEGTAASAYCGRPHQDYLRYAVNPFDIHRLLRDIYALVSEAHRRVPSSS